VKDNRYKILIIFALFWIIADQLSKWLIVHNLPLHEGFVIIPQCANIVHVRNYGAAFGFLNNPDTDWQFWFFVCVTLFALGIILHFMRKMPYSKILSFGFACILGGAVGNFADRVRLRYVIDFIDIYYDKWHWPVFNVADIAICFGTLIIAYIFYKEPKR
jgi:signal peptidase II